MDRRFFVAVLAMAVLASGCAHKPTIVSQSVDSYFGSSKVFRYALANGLKVLVLPDHSAPTFAYQTWYNVGSRDEKTGRTGLAHFFEHMMFKSTKVHPEGEFDRMMEVNGAEGENAFTSHDYTAYVQSLPSDRLELACTLESDRMVNLLVLTDAVNSEREVVQNERRYRTENNPNGLLYEKMYDLAFTKHSYRHPVIGYDEDLKQASVKDFESFYRNNYAPNDATVVVVGDVDPDATVRLIAKHYGSLPTTKLEKHTPAVEPEQTLERVAKMEIKSPVEKFVIGYHIPNVNSVDFPAIEAAREILAGGKSSRLHRKLVDGGIATAVDLESAEQKDPGILMFFVSLQPGRTAAQALAVIDREIADMASGHVTTEEIQRAVAMHRFSVFDDLASNYSKAQFLGFYETVAGNFQRGVQIVDELTTASHDEIVKALKTVFRKNNRSVVIGTPAKGAHS